MEKKVSLTVTANETHRITLISVEKIQKPKNVCKGRKKNLLF